MKKLLYLCTIGNNKTHTDMKKKFEQIKREIQDALCGTLYEGETATEEILTRIVGREVEWYDSSIDDGADGDDDYVIKDCYSTKDDKIIVRIYFGNCTREIGYVSVTE